MTEEETQVRADGFRVEEVEGTKALLEEDLAD